MTLCPHIGSFTFSERGGETNPIIFVRSHSGCRWYENGAEVESGAAVLQPGKTLWRYTATVADESLEGDKIVVRVSGTPGNLPEGEQPAYGNFGNVKIIDGTYLGVTVGLTGVVAHIGFVDAGCI